MANKEKNTKEEPYLLNDEELDEVEDVTREVPGKKYDIDYDPITGKFRSPKDFEEFKKEIEDMEPEEGMRVTIDDNAESAIIDTEPMAAESKKKRKINLSESEIMSILGENQNLVMTKSKFIQNIKENLISEARMNDNVRRGFESGENDYNDILGQELTNQLAQESFEEIADNIRRKTGKQNVTIDDVQRLLSSSIMSAAQEEYRIGTENLERKAVDMIRKNFNIPADAVEFDAKITGIPPRM